MRVTTWTLEMRSADALATTRTMPGDVRVELAEHIDPEFARYLYARVGGPWRWNDRLAWSRQQWSDDLAVPGTETWVAYRAGAPCGYVQLQPQVTGDASEVEIRYFGLIDSAIGHGIGGALLEFGMAKAWSLPSRHDLPAANRVWLHTCDLDGPAALANYRARGLQLLDTSVDEQDYPPQPYGAWFATGGPHLDRSAVHDDIRLLVAGVPDVDDVARDHREQALAWLESTTDIWRRAKPRTPAPHLVSYFLLVDRAAQRFLLCDHRLSGLWLPTGGHVEFGEHPRETVLREAREELGIDAHGHVGEPVLITVTDTNADLVARHTDVSLWFTIDGSVAMELEPDEREFAGVRWWSAEEYEGSDPSCFDPHMGRMLEALGWT